MRAAQDFENIFLIHKKLCYVYMLCMYIMHSNQTGKLREVQKKGKPPDTSKGCMNIGKLYIFGKVLEQGSARLCLSAISIDSGENMHFSSKSQTRIVASRGAKVDGNVVPISLQKCIVFLCFQFRHFPENAYFRRQGRRSRLNSLINIILHFLVPSPFQKCIVSLCSFHLSRWGVSPFFLHLPQFFRPIV